MCRSLSDFAFQIYSLPSLVEVVVTALTESTSFDKSEITVSLFWLKLIDGPHRVTLPVRNTVSLFLVEAVLTALAELFCETEFIVSLRWVETIRRP